MKSGEFIRAHNLTECCNFIDTYIEKVIVYEEKVDIIVDIIFKVNIFDKQTGTISQMKSEGTKEAVAQGYCSKQGIKRSGTGQKKVIQGQAKTAVNL